MVEINKDIVENAKADAKAADTVTVKESPKWYLSKKLWLGVIAIITAVITPLFPVPTPVYNAIIGGFGALNILILSLDGSLTR
jgi:hypothetical protein